MATAKKSTIPPTRFNDSVDDYVASHSTAADPLLAELERATYVNYLRPHMVAGHIQGKVLEMLSCMMQPKRILELGTFTGYSALCMAKGLAPDGELHTIDINDELEDFTRSFFNRSPHASQIHYHLGDARDIIPTLGGNFDMAFIDADKREYPEYYELVFKSVRVGGFIIADDVLWYGKVLTDTDAFTRALQQFNDMVMADSRVENVIFPIRDGLMVARKVCE